MKLLAYPEGPVPEDVPVTLKAKMRDVRTPTAAPDV